jgi:hypothetical protein
MIYTRYSQRSQIQRSREESKRSKKTDTSSGTYHIVLNHGERQVPFSAIVPIDTIEHIQDFSHPRPVVNILIRLGKESLDQVHGVLVVQILVYTPQCRAYHGECLAHRVPD